MLFILNKNYEVVESLNDRGNMAVITPYFDDEYLQDLATGAETFTFSTLGDSIQSQHIVVGNFIAFRHKDEYKLFNIINVDEERSDIFIKNVYCEMASIELINEIVRPMNFSGTVKNFINTILSETSWELGKIDMSLINTIDLELKDYKSVYSLLQEHIVESFGAEISYRVKIEHNKIVGKYVDVYSQRGKDSGLRFTYTKNLTSIVRTIDTSNIATALIGIGNSNITFKDLDLPDKPAGQDFIVNESAYRLWNINGHHIMGTHKVDTDSPQELLNLTRKALEERSVPQTKYEVKVELLGGEVEIGDTIKIIDHGFNPPIYLEGRVNQLKISHTDPTKNECVLANFKELGTNISAELKELAGYVDSKFPINGSTDIIEGTIGKEQISQQYHTQVIADAVYASMVETEELIATKADIEQLNAINATIKNLQAENVTITGKLEVVNADIENLKAENVEINGSLTATAASIKDLYANKASVKELYATKAEIETLKASKIDVSQLNATKAEIETLIAKKANIESLNALQGVIKVLESSKANISDLNAVNATIGSLQANKADIMELNVIKGKVSQLETEVAEIGTLKSEVADINELLAGNITAENIASNTITAGSGIIADGAIGSAQISSLDASKINSGTVDTSKVTIQGANGHLRLKGNRLQVFTGTGNQAKERVSLGDVNGNGTIYGLRVRGLDGQTILLDENGVTREGITDGSIDNSKISDDANIDGSKLNINSVVSKINEDDTEVIKGTKIEVDGTSLTTKFSTITNKQTEHEEKITQHSSSIKANQDAIKLKVDNQTYTTDKKDMTSKLNKNTSEISAMKGQIALKVEQSDIENTINNIQIGTRNLLKGTADFNPKYWEGTNLLNSIQDIEPSEIETLLLNEKYNGHAIAKITGVYPNGVATQMSVQGFKFEVGETYTISVMAKGMTEELQMGITISGNRVNYKPQKIGTSWKKYTWTFVSDADTLQRFRFESANANTTNYIAISEIKIEKGTKATDYTIAPEDIDEKTDTKINSAKAEIKVTTDAISQNVSKLSQTVSNKADGSTVTTLSNKVGSLETSVNGISGKVTNLETTTTTIGKKANDAMTLAETANGMANTNKTNISSLNGQVSTIKSQVATLDVNLQGITQRVSNTESTTTTLTSKVNTAQSTANQAKTDASNALNTANSANSKINNLEVGGRNYCLDTATSKTMIGNNTSNQTNYMYSISNPSDLAGKNINVSFKYTISNYSGGSFRLQTNTPSYFSGSNIITPSGNGTFTSTYTIAYSSNFASTMMGIRLDNFVGTIVISELKLERGNKPTSWTPAPEDIQSQLDTNKTEISSTKSQVASIETNLTGITQRVTNTEKNVTTITNTANNANSNATTALNTANQAKTDASSANSTANTANTNATNALNKANSANSKIDNLQIGGRNIVKDTGISKSIVGTGTTNKTGCQYNFTIPYLTHIKNKELIVVFDWKYEGENPSGTFNMQTGEPQYATVVGTQTINTTNTSGTITKIWKPTGVKDTKNIYIRTDNMVGTFTMSNLRIYFGTKDIGWTPAPEDVKQDVIDKANQALNDAKSYTTTEITKTNNKVSSIETNLNGITSRVSNVETTTAKITDLAKAMAGGKTLYTDAMFKKGDNGIKVYNNTGNGNVIINRITKVSGCPTTSTHCLEIKSVGAASPSFGGFYFATPTKANQILVTRIIAKIPTGRNISWYSNSIGANGENKWLTSTAGTGKWEEYICKVKCGDSGTFSTTNFFAITEGSTPTTAEPLIWYVAYATVIDITDNDESINELTSRMSSAEQKITDSAIINTVSSTIDKKVSTGINNIQIGDRNLLLMDNVVNRDSKNFTKDGYTVSFTHSAEYQGVQINNLRETMELGKEYCLQYKIKKIEGSLLGISHHCDAQFEVIDFVVDNKLQNATAVVTNMNIDDNNWHNCTLRVKRKTDATGDSVNRIIPQPNRGKATSVTVEMKDFKISQGNKFGDWTPAPEDVGKQISNTETMLNGNIDNAVSGAKTEILNDVSKNYAKNEKITQLQEVMDSKFQQTSKDMTMQFNTAQNYTKEIDGKLQSFQNTVATHIRFSENGIDLGKTNSVFSATLDNTKLAFKQSGEEIAYISNNKMYITQAEIKETLRIGKSGSGFFSWVQGTEGNLSLKWSES